MYLERYSFLPKRPRGWGVQSAQTSEPFKRTHKLCYYKIRMKKYSLELIVFLAGLAVMVLELDGSRILAPYLGTSLYTWTSLIGIILGALSLGYFLGGKLADKKPSFKTLSIILLLAAISIGLIGLVKEPFLKFIQNEINDIRVGSIVATTILFVIPSVLLGMVSPYAVKLKIETLAKSGRTVGNLYAISTIGSIVGTFLAGFYLIPAMGNTKILYLIAIILLIAASISYSKNFVVRSLVIVLIFLSIVGMFYKKTEAKIIDVDSQYNRIIISEGTDQETGRPAKYIYTDPFGTQSAIFTDNDNDLVFQYTKYYRLVDHFSPNSQNVLMIGGGAYSYPKDFLTKHAEGNIDVVEIDSKFTELARQYFNLTDNPRLGIIHEDGRIFLNKTDKKYDAILIDAFKSLTPPWQLATKESAEKMYLRMDDNGVVIANIVSALEGEKSKFARAEFTTFRSIFPQVYFFQVYKIDPKLSQNLILVAQKSAQKPSFQSSNEELNSYLKNFYRGKINESYILTDNFAPVENLTLNLY